MTTTRRLIQAHIVVLLLLAAALAAAIFPTGAQASDDREEQEEKQDDSTTDRLQVVSVKALDASTVDVTFNHGLAVETTDVSRKHFHGDHLDYEVPHTHDVSAVALINEGKTARLTFARALHPEEAPCDDPLPKCSDDEIPLIIKNVADVYANVVNNSDWEIWDTGAEN